jgi:hypothetical protein
MVALGGEGSKTLDSPPLGHLMKRREPMTVAFVCRYRDAYAGFALTVERRWLGSAR